MTDSRSVSTLLAEVRRLEYPRTVLALKDEGQVAGEVIGPVFVASADDFWHSMLRAGEDAWFAESEVCAVARALDVRVEVI